MPEYKTPGVYVEEISAGPRPVAAAATTDTGFVAVLTFPKQFLGGTGAADGLFVPGPAEVAQLGWNRALAFRNLALPVADAAPAAEAKPPVKGKKPLPVPEEISLLLSHLCAILGATQMALVLMCLLAALTSSSGAKKLALRVMVVFQLSVMALQFHKPR